MNFRILNAAIILFSLASLPGRTQEFSPADAMGITVVTNQLKEQENRCTLEDTRTYIHPQASDFTRSLHQCGRASMGDRNGTTRCILDKNPGLSIPCADCFGQATACGKSKCLLKCMVSSTSDGCIQCTQANCTPALSVCTGVPIPLLPPPR